MISTRVTAPVTVSRNVTRSPGFSPSTGTALCGTQAGIGSVPLELQFPLSTAICRAAAGSEISCVCSRITAPLRRGRSRMLDCKLTSMLAIRPGRGPWMRLPTRTFACGKLFRVTEAVTTIADPGRPVSSLRAATAMTALRKDTAAAVNTAVVIAVRTTAENATRCVTTCLSAGGGRRTPLPPARGRRSACRTCMVHARQVWMTKM